MPNPNDIYECGPLPPEDAHLAHLRGKLGFSMMIQKRAIARRLIAEGADPSQPFFDMQVSRVYREEHENDIPYREYQATVLKPRWAAESQRRFDAGELERGGFTKSQWEMVFERFAGSNSPDGIAIAERAMAMLATESATKAA